MIEGILELMRKSPYLSKYNGRNVSTHISRSTALQYLLAWRSYRSTRNVDFVHDHFFAYDYPKQKDKSFLYNSEIYWE